MTSEIKIPSMGESITSGIISTLHVKDGDIIKKGQLIYELETDKITAEGQANVDGQIKLTVTEGDEVEIGQVIATINESEVLPSHTTSIKAEKLPSFFKHSIASKKNSYKETKPV